MGKRPNFLFITSDQQHWKTLGLFNSEINTPNLDSLGRAETVFTRAYCVNPTCTPTRAYLITGKYPSRHGAWSLGTKLTENERTLGELLRERGYRTALAGKAHFQPTAGTDLYPSLESVPLLQDLDFWRNFNGPFYGFEHVELIRNHTDEPLVGQHYAIWMEEKGFSDWRKCFRAPAGTAGKQKHRWNLPEKYHYSAWIAERACCLMENYKKNDENFFLWASFPDPHPSYLVPEPWDTMYDPRKITVPAVKEDEHGKNPPHFKMTQEKYPDFSPWSESGYVMHGFGSHLVSRKDLAKNIAVYYGMVSLMDKYIGRILDKLRELRLEEDTIVVFTSDHGHFFGQHGLTAKGAFHYEDLLRVPMIVSWPGNFPAGRMSCALQSLVDFAPTVLKFAGTEIPREMTGADQSEVWLGTKKKARDHAIVQNRHEPTTIHLRTYINDTHKITVYYNRDYGELFDLENDPGEANNLWSDPEHAGLKCELIKKLLFAEMGREPLWMPKIANA